MAVPQRGGLGHPPRHTAASIIGPTGIEVDRRGVRMAPGAGQPAPGAKRLHEPAGQIGTRIPGSGDAVDALERQLQEADARLRAMYDRDWLRETPDSAD